MNEAHADDGAIHSFWDFIAFVRALPDPPDYAGRLDNPGRLREAVEDYEDIS